MTTLHEHLGQLVRYAPPGTLVPVDSLAELLRTYSEELQRPAPAGLSMGEVAERFARVVGGQRKTPQEDTVRKWIRRGLRGVKLKAFRAGRHLRVLESDFNAFVLALSDGPTSTARSGENVFPAGTSQPETELEAFLTHFRDVPQSRPRSPSRAGASGSRRTRHAART